MTKSQEFKKYAKQRRESISAKKKEAQNAWGGDSVVSFCDGYLLAIQDFLNFIDKND